MQNFSNSHNFGSLFGDWLKFLPQSAVQQGLVLSERVKSESASGRVIFPSNEDVFRALRLTQPSSVKAVILGQDVYHERGQANGLAFSVNDGVRLPPSLQNIFKELHSDLGIEATGSGDLTPWAKQGVLLLNTVLTVYEGKANSCADWGWQEITSEIIKTCFCLPQPIVFISWGRQAQQVIDNAKKDIIIRENKAHICSSHPSPLGAYKAGKDMPAFIGSKPFSATNKLLTELGSMPIDWRLNNYNG